MDIKELKKIIKERFKIDRDMMQDIVYPEDINDIEEHEYIRYRILNSLIKQLWFSRTEKISDETYMYFLHMKELCDFAIFLNPDIIFIKTMDPAQKFTPDLIQVLIWYYRHLTDKNLDPTIFNEMNKNVEKNLIFKYFNIDEDFTKYIEDKKYFKFLKRIIKKYNKIFVKLLKKGYEFEIEEDEKYK